MIRRTPVPGPTPTQVRNAVARLERDHGWMFTRRAVQQMIDQSIDPGAAVRVAVSPEVRNPALRGTESLWADGLALLTNREQPQLIIAVTRRDVPPKPDPAAARQGRAKSGGAGRKMPSSTREFTDMLRDKGFEVVSTANGHLRITHPDRPGFNEYTSSTGSDHRGYANSIARITRITGIDPTR